MAHRTKKPVYAHLVERLNRFPQGAAPSELLNKILKILFNEQEARLVADLPIKPFTVKKAALIWNKRKVEARKILEELASRGLLVDVRQKGKTFYVLPPPMAGFFEFSMMRVRKDIDQNHLAELYHQYINVEEDFIKNLFTKGETQLGRTFVSEPALSGQNALHVLDYERASRIIEKSTHMSVSMCYCRHKMLHLDKACDAPMEICMSFGDIAVSLANNGNARLVTDIKERKDLLEMAYDNNLVQFGENVREDVGFICNCCKCCCEAIIAARKFAHLNPVHTTNFLPEIDQTNCTNCGQCLEVCPVDALTFVQDASSRSVQLDQETCLGCGLCVKVCPSDALSLEKREKRVITPVNSAHRIVVMALERGQLQNLIFDNQALWSHRALAAILGVILQLPPLKQIMANRQIKSRYLEYLIKFFEDKHYELTG